MPSSTSSWADLIVKLSALGVYPPNPAGEMTGSQIINAISATLGGNYWLQGISGAVLVNSFNADSADLAPYLDVDEKWHIPDGTVLVVNTDSLSAESIIERIIYAEGSIYLISDQGSGKGIFLEDGTGSNTKAFEFGGFGDVVFFGPSLYSTDNTRQFFDSLTNGGEFYYCGECNNVLGLANMGYLNFSTISIITNSLFLQETMPVIGDDCTKFFLRSASIANPFFGSQVGFDLTTTPSSGDRLIYVNGCIGTPEAGYIITIDTDNGANHGVFLDNYAPPIVGSGLITADDNPDFDSDSLLSANWEFYSNIQRANTKRIGECYFTGDQTITITNTDTWYDFFEAAISEGDLSNGIEMTENPGELEYTLENPGMILVNVNIEGRATTGSQDYSFGAFFKPAAGAYAQVTKGGFAIEQDSDQQGNAATLHANLQYTLRMEQGDKFKVMIKNITGDNDFDIHNLSIFAEVLS